MGALFPDGMIVIEGPNCGYLTDPMVWNTSSMREQMVAINATRHALGLRHLYFYADKIFRSDLVVIAAYSPRWGVLQPWMINYNNIMTKLRVSVEWAFGKVKYLFKKDSLQLANKLMATEPTGDFVLAAFFSNCRTCLQWDGPFRTTFGVVPPSLEDFLSQ